MLCKNHTETSTVDLKLRKSPLSKQETPFDLEAGSRGKPFPEVSWTKDKDATDLTRSPRVKIGQLKVIPA